MVSRRNLLKTVAFGALTQAPLGRTARAMAKAAELEAGHPAAREPHFFVFVQMQGAWDPCIAFEPKDRSLTLPSGQRGFDQPYAVDEVRSFGGIPLAPQGFVLGAYADRLAIINGIDMQVDLGHTPELVMSGQLQARQSGASFVQAALAKRHPYLKHLSMPHIYSAYDGQFLSGPYSSTSVVSTPGDIVTMMSLSGAHGDATLPRLTTVLQDYQQELSSISERRVFQSYVNAVPAASALRLQLAAGKFLPPTESSTAAGMGQLFGQLFALGIVGSVTWQLGIGGSSSYNFDTHSNHFATHPLGKALHDVDTLAKEFAKIRVDDHTSVWDRTTVLLSSEFTRTPRIISNEGKDHNIHANSLVLIGAKVRPGVYGASGTRQTVPGSYEAHAALPVDRLTGKPAASGEVLRMRDVWAGLSGPFGVDLSREFGTDVKPIGFLS